MKVRGLALTDFMRHKDTRLAFPDTGVVVVQGRNGHGKSSLSEGIAYALFGETLRGTSPFGEAGGRAECITDKGTVTRERKGGKARVTWDGGGTADTATKAQVALEATFGTFEVWRAAHVFRSADVARLTQATDKERKLFLEAYCGTGRFDAALVSCRDDLRAAKSAAEAARARIQRHESEAAGHAKRVNDAQAQLASLPPEEPGEGDEAALKQLGGTVASVERVLGLARSEWSKLESSSAVHRAEAQGLQRRLAKLGTGTCDACGQPVAQALRAQLEAQVESHTKAARGAAEANAEASDSLRAQMEEDQETLGRLRAKEAILRREIGARQATLKARASAERALKEAQEALYTAQSELVAANGGLPLLDREVALLTAAEAVLGLRGVRAGILTTVLAGLEKAANAWLPKLAGTGLKLELLPYTEKKSGGVSDAISLRVSGAGGGYGYQAASDGERRRIDVALMLALAGDGTLVMDEVLDSLDSDGVDAVASVLAELSAERCVMIVTHSDELAERVKAVVPGALRWRVEDGKVQT